jgi:hypothetical protein
MNLRVAFEAVPFDLGRLPSLRHFKIQVEHDFRDMAMPRFLNRLLSMSSSTSIESLEIKLNVRHGRTNDLFSPEAGWPELDEMLTCANFVCLKKITLSLILYMESMMEDGDQKKLGQINLPALLPMFRASSSQRTLETCLQVVVV